jgi:hypothetical protein
MISCLDKLFKDATNFIFVLPEVISLMARDEYGAQVLMLYHEAKPTILHFSVARINTPGLYH